ncbi:phage baseplate assembly protein V [Yersinia ruckeri]|uniref:phage baseplate assembly protein V n=1 Tax=Yersinia ruckeri TaxID=29486 RepID=UPI0020BD7299|nr:phage baseplate assembly protein V [Yersinia ruckeri]EKN4689582.1 baseplate protein [Yersinia ruckeri]MCK8586396.1 phage baseplate assembly protein V [Yersinia ruckeri]MCW6615638.1 phage baseplate assembly protein V [Yersinia ruckeri]
MSNSINGKHRAHIVATEHPEGLMKAKIRLLSLWDNLPDSALPWAEYHLPIGGAFSPSIIGDLVWVEFPYSGDSRYPMITGAAQDALNGIPNVAPEASGQAGAYEPPAIEGAPAIPTLTPTKDFVYKRNNLLIIHTAGGGISITNTANGASIGMNEAGDVFQNAVGDYFLNIGGKTTVKSKGVISMESDSGFHAKAPEFVFSKK